MKHKIANVIVENCERAKQYPSLYCRANSLISAIDRYDKIKCYDGGKFDFLTYFNAVSLSKWRKYASIDNLHLHLEIAGSKGKVKLVYADQFSLYTEDYDIAPVEFDATENVAELEFEYPIDDAVMVSFEIESEGTFELSNSYFYTEVDDSALRDVTLSLCTTTFKKEQFIIPNVKAIHDDILNSDSEIAQNFWIHVVDNGRTLTREDFPECDHIFLHENANVGGAGGFTRGILESKDQKEDISHVLLMDDDVSVSTESIFRTYALLKIVNDEYKNALVSGAMLDIDFPYSQWEDAGRIDKVGHFVQAKHPFNVTYLKDCLKNEMFSLDDARYAAWWYCVIPTHFFDEVGLPLPLFVRSDDTEYGCRCNTNFMTMNALCVWHKGFRIRYDAAVERYQTTRNTLISNAVSGVYQAEWFIAQAKDGLRVEIKKFNYKNAELVLDALEDFLKGPDFIMTKGKAEEMFMVKHKTCEQLKPIDEALLDLPENLREEAASKIDFMSAYDRKQRTIKQRIFDLISLNGQRLIGNLGLPKRRVVVMPAEGWEYMPEKVLGAEYIFAVDFNSKKAAVRHKDKSEFKHVYKRFKHDMRRYKREKQNIVEKYRSAKPVITGEKFWRDYLDMN